MAVACLGPLSRRCAISGASVTAIRTDVVGDTVDLNCLCLFMVLGVGATCLLLFGDDRIAALMLAQVGLM